MAFRPRLTALALLATALAIAMAWHSGRGRAVPSPGEDLLRIVPGHRPVLGRPTVEMPYAPFDPAAAPVGSAAREPIFIRLLGAKVGEAPGGASALALFYVRRAEAGDAHRALRDAPDPVDRGVVLLALDRPDEALEEFTKALAERPADPAALFDRALALETLHLDRQARPAWEAFLRVEGEGDWAEEARRCLAALAAPRAVAEPTIEQRKREAVTRLYEPRPEGFESFRPVAEVLAAAGDRLLLRELDYLARLDEAAWSRRADEARRFGRLREEVLAGLDRGRELAALARTSDPLLGVKALHHAAYGALDRGDPAEGRRWLEALTERCGAVGCLEELALAASDRGTLRQREGDYAAALRAFETARDLLPPIFATRRAELDAKQASIELRSGAPERAIELLGAAIQVEHELAGRGLARTLIYRGLAERDLGRTAAAMAFWVEGAAVARENGDLGLEAEATQKQAEAVAAEGRRSEAIALLADVVERLRGTQLRLTLAGVLGELAVLSAEEGQLDEARRLADEAVDLARDGQTALILAQALAVRARVGRLVGAGADALGLLREAVALDEARARDAPGALDVLGVRLSAAARRLDLVLALGDAGLPAEAFGAFAGGPPAGLRPDECRLGLGHVDGRLVVVAATSAGPAFRAYALSHAELAELQRTGAIGGPLVEALAEGGVCPAGVRRISVLEVPGSVLLPLATAIRDLRPGVLVGVTHHPDSRWPEPRRPGSALVVYDPVLREHSLPALPGARQEAAILRSLIPATTELRGEQANPEELRGGVGGVDLVHFAVHGISRSGVGAASYLLLAGDPGRLQVANILSLDLTERRPLVVLSACRTAGVPGRHEHDGAGLPWAFLEAGASAVLGTEGDLADHLAVEFAALFYERLLAGLPVSEAVAEAEQALSRREPGAKVPRFVLYF